MDAWHPGAADNDSGDANTSASRSIAVSWVLPVGGREQEAPTFATFYMNAFVLAPSQQLFIGFALYPGTCQGLGCRMRMTT